MQIGKLAKEYCGVELPLQVLRVNGMVSGYYIGTLHPEEGPYSRESVELFRTREEAEKALADGNWTQKQVP